MVKFLKKLMRKRDHLGRPLPEQVLVKPKQVFNGDDWKKKSVAFADHIKPRIRSLARKYARKNIPPEKGERQITEWFRQQMEELDNTYTSATAPFYHLHAMEKKRRNRYDKDGHIQELRDLDGPQVQKKLAALQAGIEARREKIITLDNNLRDAESDLDIFLEEEFTGSRPSNLPSLWPLWIAYPVIAGMEFFINASAVEHFSDSSRIVAWGFAAALTVAFFIISKWLAYEFQKI